MPHPGHDKDMERALDEALMATFPASDPVALSAHLDRGGRAHARPSRRVAKRKGGKRR